MIKPLKQPYVVTGVGRSITRPEKVRYQRSGFEGFRQVSFPHVDAALKRVQKSWSKRWGQNRG